MKNIWLLMKTNTKRNMLGIFIAIFGGAMLCLILFAMGNLVADGTLAKGKVGMIDYDNSILTKDFKDYLTEQLNFDIIETMTYDELTTELIDKQISAIIEIPKDFYTKASIGNVDKIVITTLDDYENVGFLQVYLNNYMSSIQILSDSADGNREVFDQLLSEYKKEEIKITQSAAQTIDKKELADKAGFINSIGFFLMFIFAISIILVYMIIDDRLTGILSRIQVTPVKPVQYIIGSAIFGILISVLMITIYCVYIKVVDVTIGVPFPILVFFMGLFSLFTICFSIAVALSLKTKNAVTSVVIGFSTIGCILGGAYFPLELAPQSLQNLARILPQFWFMDAFRILQADPGANIYPNVIILILFTVLAFLIGAVLFSQNYKKS